MYCAVRAESLSTNLDLASKVLVCVRHTCVNVSIYFEKSRLEQSRKQPMLVHVTRRFSFMMYFFLRM